MQERVVIRFDGGASHPQNEREPQCCILQTRSLSAFATQLPAVQRIKHKNGLLNLAEELGNVSKACQVTGYSRSTFIAINQPSMMEGRKPSWSAHAGSQIWPVNPTIHHQVNNQHTKSELLHIMGMCYLRISPRHSVGIQVSAAFQFEQIVSEWDLLRWLFPPFF